MLKLLRIKADSFVLLTPSGPLYGNLRLTAMRMTAFGVDWRDIEDGIVSLELNEHSVAHYGVNRTFIFSERI